MSIILRDHDTIVQAWVEQSPPELNFPPPCWRHMEGRFVQWDRTARILVAHFPLNTQFQNPRQYMQGGFAVAALDNVLGPLSNLSGVPSLTVQLNTSFIRPVAPYYDYIEVTAAIVDQTVSKIFSNAKARSPSGKLLSTVQATSHIV